MQITDARQKDLSESAQMRSGWWLVPSVLGGAVTWGTIIAALVR
ncbi:MAG: hypothetical protein V4720_04720 [Pseudomonadota bacterium]|nr:hypothetical protein [Tabrizicola sp.]